MFYRHCQSVSRPSGKRARRRETARLVQRQGAARRSGKTRLAVAPPRLLESFLPYECWSFWQTQLCSLKTTSYRTNQEFCTHQLSRMCTPRWANLIPSSFHVFADYFSPWVQLLIAPRHANERNFGLGFENRQRVAVRNTVFLSSCRCSLDFVPTPPFLGLQRASQPLACIPRTTTSDNANYQSWFWSHGATRTPSTRCQDTQTCPARRPISLASAYALCVCQGIQWSWVECHNFYSK